MKMCENVLKVPAGLSSERPRCSASHASLVFLSNQVLFCYEQFDELTLLHLREFDKKKLISVETDIVVDHYKEEKFEDSKPGLRSYDCCTTSVCNVHTFDFIKSMNIVQLSNNRDTCKKKNFFLQTISADLTYLK